MRYKWELFSSLNFIFLNILIIIYSYVNFTWWKFVFSLFVCCLLSKLPLNYLFDNSLFNSRLINTIQFVLMTFTVNRTIISVRLLFLLIHLCPPFNESFFNCASNVKLCLTTLPVTTNTISSISGILANRAFKFKILYRRCTTNWSFSMISEPNIITPVNTSVVNPS